MTTQTTAVKSNQRGAIKTVEAKAKAFSGEGVRLNRFRIEDGEVRVWDASAGYYTSCHTLSVNAVRRILRLADAN